MLNILYPSYILKRLDVRSILHILKYFVRNYKNVIKGHIRFVGELTGCYEKELKQYLYELHNNNNFFEQLEINYRNIYHKGFHLDFFETTDSDGSVFFQATTMYLLTRALKPKVILETGGAEGKTTTFFLKAIEDNADGSLITIDLNPETLPDEIYQKEYTWWHKGAASCFIVPEKLKKYHRLILKDSRDALPKVLLELKGIDMFRHDGLHTYENMMFEYVIAWESLRRGGILVSDDIGCNTAFFDFCKKINRNPVISTIFLAGIQK